MASLVGIKYDGPVLEMKIVHLWEPTGPCLGRTFAVLSCMIGVWHLEGEWFNLTWQTL